MSHNTPNNILVNKQQNTKLEQKKTKNKMVNMADSLKRLPTSNIQMSAKVFRSKKNPAIYASFASFVTFKKINIATCISCYYSCAL